MVLENQRWLLENKMGSLSVTSTNVSCLEGHCWRYICKLAESFDCNTLSSWVCFSVVGLNGQRAKSIFHKWRTTTILYMYICNVAGLFINSQSYKMVLSGAMSAFKALWEQLHSSERRHHPPRQHRDANRRWQPRGTLLSQPNRLNQWPGAAPDMGHSRNWVDHTGAFDWCLPIW